MTVSQLNLVRESVMKVKDMSESATGRCQEPGCLSSKSFGSLKSDMLEMGAVELLVTMAM